MYSNISCLCTMKHHQKGLSYAIYLLIDSILSDNLYQMYQLGVLFLVVVLKKRILPIVNHIFSPPF